MINGSDDFTKVIINCFLINNSIFEKIFTGIL